MPSRALCHRRGPCRCRRCSLQQTTPPPPLRRPPPPNSHARKLLPLPLPLLLPLPHRQPLRSQPPRRLHLLAVVAVRQRRLRPRRRPLAPLALLPPLLLLLLPLRRLHRASARAYSASLPRRSQPPPRPPRPPPPPPLHHGRGRHLAQAPRCRSRSVNASQCKRSAPSTAILLTAIGSKSPRRFDTR